MYAERPARAPLRPLLVCTWTRSAELASRARIVPDACVDIVWDGAGLRVAGPDTRAVAHTLTAGARYAGVRFAPGAAPAVLGVPASAIRDTRVALTELWGEQARRLRDRLGALTDPSAAAAVLEDAVAARSRTHAVDPLVHRLVARLAADASLPARRLAAELGIGERQLLRRCTAAFGYGPKQLARILRFQRALQALRRDPQCTLASLAVAHGYADQAHLAHDVRALAGVPPSALRAEARVAMSDLDKPSPAGTPQTEGHDYNHRP